MTFQDALPLALKRLQRSDAFEAEVAETLRKNGVEDSTVQEVIAHLKARRILDDKRTIENLVASRSGRRAVGVEKLRAELVRRGAPEELVDGCLAGIPAEEQLEGMLSALRARCKPTDSRAKGARLLLSRGFPEEGIESALDEFFGSERFPD